jgi:hypothetical protein
MLTGRRFSEDRRSCEGRSDMNEDNAVELILKLYETNYDYQNKKEEKVWLASSVYLSFSVAVMVWLLSIAGTDTPISFGKVPFMILMACLSGAAIVFVYDQNWNKAWSVRREYRLIDRLKRLDFKEKPTYRRTVNAAYPRTRLRFWLKCHISWKHGRSGIFILIAMLIFAITLEVLAYSAIPA